MTEQQRSFSPHAQREIAGFGRSAQRIADELMALAARPEASWMQPDAYSWDEIRHVADTLHGMVLRYAVEIDDPVLLAEVTGRTWRSADAARAHERADGS
jgi:hypothetical protein